MEFAHRLYRSMGFFYLLHFSMQQMQNGRMQRPLFFSEQSASCRFKYAFDAIFFDVIPGKYFGIHGDVDAMR